MSSNLTADRLSFVSHRECSLTGERHEPYRVHGLSRAGKPLLVRNSKPLDRHAAIGPGVR